MSNIFGFACTPIHEVQRICEGIVGREKVQVMSGRDSIANRRCYVVVGVATLGSHTLAALSRCRAVLVVLDSPPQLTRVAGLMILDAAPGATWSPVKVDLIPLRRALRADQRFVSTSISPDSTVASLVDDVRSRGILDRVLAVARSMSPSERAQLNTDVCLNLAGKTAISTVMRRVASTGAPAALVESLREGLTSGVAERISQALADLAAGGDLMPVAAERRVDPAELRFISSHLRESEAAARGRRRRGRER